MKTKSTVLTTLLFCVFTFSAMTIFVLPAQAVMLYTDSTSFQNQLATFIVDDYSHAGYDLNGSSNIDIHSNAYMSSVLGETDYNSTGWIEHNIIQQQSTNPTYCTGCNGSFLLGFTTTSVGDSSGVFGAGFDVVGVDPNVYSYVTFGDGSTANYSLSGMAGSFWGITSDLSINSIHVGLINGGTTKSDSVWIDNLTIGSTSVPEPSTMLLLGSGLFGLGAFRNKFNK